MTPKVFAARYQVRKKHLDLRADKRVRHGRSSRVKLARGRSNSRGKRVLPRTAVSICNNRSRWKLLRDLVGGREQRRWHGKVEHPGRLVIGDQFKLGRLHNRQVSRARALEDPAG